VEDFMYGQIAPRQHPQGLGDTDVANMISSFGKGLASSQIKGVFFRSQVSPDIKLDPLEIIRGAPRTFSEGGVSEAFLKFVKPAVYLDTNWGSLKVAPWGEPKTNYFPFLLIGTVLGGAVVGGLIWRGLKRRKK
jgi:hypothetical protein